MPWKNGGGTTTELSIEPVGASLESGFFWRLSMAEVGVSGPFSRFEGYDRTLLLLEGNGMRLDFAQRAPVPLDRLLEPVTFPGDWDSGGTLLDGPCRDFNVITHRAHCRHRLAVLHLATHPAPILQAHTRYLFCVKGKVQINHCELSAMELLRVDVEAQELEATGASGAVLIAIGIDPAE
jgi:environmental stress-induced protein Ves